MTVLVVADDEKVLGLYESMFRQWEWDFVLARSVDNALAVLSGGENRIDLVIMDLRKNGKGQGTRFLGAMQARTDIHDLPVVIIADNPEMVLAGSWDGLIKASTPVTVVPRPFSQEELLDGIDGVRQQVAKSRRSGHLLALVLEDNDVAACLHIGLLTSWGFNYMLARSGTQALRALYSGDHIDVVISDLVLPGMDGVDFVQRLRSNPQVGMVPIVIVTAFPEYREKDVKALGVPVVKKPVDSRELLAAIRLATGLALVGYEK